MTVRDLIDELENFDKDMEVIIGMRQTYGSDFAMDVEYDIDEHSIHAFFGENYKAVVITEGSQCGVVDYNDEDDEE
jgi:hypothetical protein